MLIFFRKRQTDLTEGTRVPSRALQCVVHVRKHEPRLEIEAFAVPRCSSSVHKASVLCHIDNSLVMPEASLVPRQMKRPEYEPMAKYAMLLGESCFGGRVYPAIIYGRHTVPEEKVGSYMPNTRQPTTTHTIKARKYFLTIEYARKPCDLIGHLLCF